MFSYIFLVHVCKKMGSRAVKVQPHMSKVWQSINHSSQERVSLATRKEGINHQSLCVGVEDGVGVWLLTQKA